jgi:hypothetical protein
VVFFIPWLEVQVAVEVGMRLLDEQVAWVWVVQLRLVLGLEEHAAGQEIDDQVAWVWI